MAKFPKGGMPNMNNMMKQMQKMQKQMEEAQAKLEETEFTATAGGGSIEVTVNGKKELVSVNIDQEVVDPDDVEMLQDLIIVAVNDALSKVSETSEKEMGKFTGGMNIPGLF
ncbi:YbaB/EbfC family nucleoid-associated protein [Miniphocaeibacter massiliensis]|uniref:YbaB/EbfC family nucleoid-associated protein n=1 Tax=Miniphocaeibacter massiliensis TaxID=2041841 RepID=UPI000C1C8347|nr:YbaB/EbfC family nucleoid-associated protein [Miniphocaeibacter massiliensis]